MQLDTTEQARAYLTGTILNLHPTHARVAMQEGDGSLITPRICEALHAVRTLCMAWTDSTKNQTEWTYEAILFNKDGECITDPVIMSLREDGEIS